MLVLTRKPEERVRIGQNIFVQVVEIRGARVRLGITAPRDVKVLRDELPEDPGEVRRAPLDIDTVELVPPPREKRPA